MPFRWSAELYGWPGRWTATGTWSTGRRQEWPSHSTWLRPHHRPWRPSCPRPTRAWLLGSSVARRSLARPPRGWITIDPAWVNRHIVTAAVPILGRVTCNRAIIPQLRGALAEVVRRGLAHLVNPADYAG